jgi:hypothetical protein
VAVDIRRGRHREPARRQEELGTTRQVLVTGCGRSGTKYAAFVLRRLGLDVPHERLGRDGTASWPMAVHARVRPWGPGGAPPFHEVFHQVRHPLPTIASACTFKPESWRFVAEHVPCPLDAPPLLRAARYWHWWNRRAEEVATWRYRVEALPDVFDEFCARLGVAPDRGALEAVCTNVNTRALSWPHHVAEEALERLRLPYPSALRSLVQRPTPLPEVTWEDLDELDRDLCERIREQADRYGYRPG